MTPLKLYKLKRRPNVEVTKKKKPDRFNGMTEEEIIEKYTLPDYLQENLDIVFVGINPSLTAAYRGKYYAGRNHFYKLLHESGLLPEFITHEQDYKLTQYGIGLTNVVSRPSKSSADLERLEIKQGVQIVEEKLRHYKPKIAVFNGKCIYETFVNKHGKYLNYGLQPECIGNTALWLVPSSSARCSQFPRMSDKLRFYTALKKWLDFSKGQISKVDDNEFVFANCQRIPATTSIMWRRKPKSAFLFGGRICSKQTPPKDDFNEDELQTLYTEFLKKISSEEDNKENKDDVPKVEEKAKSNKLPKEYNTKKITARKTTHTVPKWKPINKVDPDEFIALIKQRVAEKANKQANLVDETDSEAD